MLHTKITNDGTILLEGSSYIRDAQNGRCYRLETVGGEMSGNRQKRRRISRSVYESALTRAKLICIMQRLKVGEVQE